MRKQNKNCVDGKNSVIEKMQQAIIWSELLSEPVSRKRRKRAHVNQGNASR